MSAPGGMWLSPALHLPLLEWLLLVGQWLQALASVHRERWKERKDLCKGITFLGSPSQGPVLLCSEGAQQEAPGTIPSVLSPCVALLPPLLSPLLSPHQALLSTGLAMLRDIPASHGTGSTWSKSDLAQHKACQSEKRWVS